MQNPADVPPVIEEIILLELKIDQKEKAAERLNQEVDSLKAALDAFLEKYYRDVGRLYVDLDRLKIKVQAGRYRMRLMEERPDDGEKAYDQAVEEAFSYQQERLKTLENEADDFEEKEPGHEPVQRRGEASDLLKRLFRKLAFHFHPDRAQTKDEKAVFHELMSQINEAYQQGELEKLEKFSRRLSLKERLKDETPEMLLARMRQVYQDLCDHVKTLAREKENLLQDEGWRLKIKADSMAETGRDLLEELAQQTREEIDKYQVELDRIGRQSMTGMMHG